MSRDEDLHGNAPDKSVAALLIVDVINDLEFPEGEQLFEHALPMAHKLLALKERATRAQIPVIYANDNFGHWQSNFHTQVAHCLYDGVRGQPITEILAPTEADYFVLKPKHSAFFSTTLDTLLEYLHVEILIITGVAANICVFFTANDAYMRDYQIIVPSDCVASNTEEETTLALRQMRQILKANTQPSTELDLERLARTPSDRH